MSDDRMNKEPVSDRKFVEHIDMMTDAIDARPDMNFSASAASLLLEARNRLDALRQRAEAAEAEAGRQEKDYGVIRQALDSWIAVAAKSEEQLSAMTAERDRMREALESMADTILHEEEDEDGGAFDDEDVDHRHEYERFVKRARAALEDRS